MKRAFLSYAREDAGLKDRLLLELSKLKFEGLIAIWQDIHGKPGEFDKEIKRQIDASEIFIALISPAFVKSSYCVEVELRRAAINWKAKKCLIVPILLKRTRGWERIAVDGRGTCLGSFNAMPFGGGPICNAVQPEHEYIKVTRNFRTLLGYKGSNASDVQNKTLHDVCRLTFEALRWCLQKDEWMHYYSDDEDAPANLHGCMDVQAPADEIILTGYDDDNENEETAARIEWNRDLNQFTYVRLNLRPERVVYSFDLNMDDSGRLSFMVQSYPGYIKSAKTEMNPQEMVSFVRDVFREQKQQDRPQRKRRK